MYVEIFIIFEIIYWLYNDNILKIDDYLELVCFVLIREYFRFFYNN